MELYYRDLISEDASLEKLVDDLMRVVQGADELAEASGANMPRSHREEIASRLKRLKEGCKRLKGQMISSSLAAEKVIRQYPYSTAGFVFAVGMVVGAAFRRRRGPEYRA